LIHEPIQGAGNFDYIINSGGFTSSGDPDYMQRAYKTVRNYGGLCIADEV